MNKPERDRQDEMRTMAGDQWNQAATVPIQPPAAGIGDAPTLPASGAPPVPAGQHPATTDTIATQAPDATRPTMPAALQPTLAPGGDSRVAATLAPEQTTGGGTAVGLTRGATGSFTRSLRTRVNANLPADTQALDIKLQTSRPSVFTDMVSTIGARGVALPKPITQRLKQQTTEGRYAVERQLAAGGMGAVLRIDDHDFSRQAAMKIMHAKLATSADAVGRFLAEAQVTAQLEHPNIVPVHDLGVMDDGTLYYTMTLIKGQSLGTVVKLLREARGLGPKGEAVQPGDEARAAAVKWTQEAILLAFLKVLDGVGFAHSRHVVHRDLKPDNVMIGAHGEVLVVDWGIAKTKVGADPNDELVKQVQSIRDADDTAQTMAGSAMGTLFYMPPEQAAGDLERIGPASDIYALGATLYELLCLERCLDGKGETAQGLLLKITTGDWIPLDRAAPGLHADLVAIVHKAMALDPAKRYPDCASMADDIRRFLAGQAVAARQRNWVERMALWYQAHRVQVLVGAAFAGVAAIAVGGGMWLQGKADREKGEALLARVAAVAPEPASPERLEALRGALADLKAAGELLPMEPSIGSRREALAAAVKAAEMTADERRAAGTRKAEAAKLAAEGAERRKAGAFKDAEERFSAAFRLTPDDGALEQALREVRTTLANAVIAQQKAEAAANRAKGDEMLAKAKAMPAADKAMPAMLEDAKKFLDLAEKDGQAPAGTGDQLATVREMMNHYQQACHSMAMDAAGRQALAAAETALAKGDLDAVQAQFGVARQNLPGDEAVDRLRERLAQARQAAAERQRMVDGRKALADAEAALAKGDLDAAQSAAGAARRLIPGDADLDRVRSEIERRSRDRELAARLAKAGADAEAALARANAEFQQILAAKADLGQADAERVRLERSLASAALAAKEPVFAARRAVADASRRIAEHWALGEAEANAALSFLAEQPQHPKLAEIRDLLCRLYLSRLQAALDARQLPEIKAFSNLIERHGGREKYLLPATTGRLAVAGPAGATLTLTRLETDGAGRLQPSGDGRRVALPADGLGLATGRWRLEGGGHRAEIFLPPGGELALSWPGELPTRAGSIPLRWVAGRGTLKPFLLGEREVTHAEWHAFVTHAEVFPEAQKAWKAVVEGAGQATLRLLPRQSPTAGELWQAEAPDHRLEKITVPKELEALPVTGIDRSDAEEFCRWLSARSGLRVRLPTAAEWRQAATGGDRFRVWPWGEAFDGSFAVCLAGGTRDSAAPAAADTLDIGPFGHRHLAGNVREWLSDRPEKDEPGAGVIDASVAGGSWSDLDAHVVSGTYVERVDPRTVAPVIGLRVLVEIP